MTQTQVRAPFQLRFTADQTLSGFKITNLGAGTIGSTDAARMLDIQIAQYGLDCKQSVRLATNAALPSYTFLADVITASANGALTVDGVAVANGDRVLVKDETAGNAPYNGIYVVTDLGSGGTPFILTRSADANTSAYVTAGMFTISTEGTANSDSGWVLVTNDPIVLDTTALLFQYFPVGGLTEANFITRETPSGTINGSNVTFTLAYTPYANSEEVFLNGLLQEPGAGNDYTISGLTITYLTAPVTGDRLKVNYRK